MRVLGVALLLVTASCATTPRTITKIVNGRVIATRAVTPSAYEHMSRAMVYEEEERWNDAAAELQRALVYDNESPELQAHLAEVFMRLDRLDDAASSIPNGAPIAATRVGITPASTPSMIPRVQVVTIPNEGLPGSSTSPPSTVT